MKVFETLGGDDVVGVAGGLPVEGGVEDRDVQRAGIGTFGLRYSRALEKKAFGG